MLPNCIVRIKDHCQLLSQFEEACKVISLSLGKRYEDLNHNHNLIVDNKRHKRAPLECVGSIYNMLFGLMDNDDQEVIESNFKTLLSNQHQINNNKSRY